MKLRYFFTELCLEVFPKLQIVQREVVQIVQPVETREQGEAQGIYDACCLVDSERPFGILVGHTCQQCRTAPLHRHCVDVVYYLLNTHTRVCVWVRAHTLCGIPVFDMVLCRIMSAARSHRCDWRMHLKHIFECTI
jgi:hypothetical protein